jgi:bacterial/archaeal transporter family protein
MTIITVILRPLKINFTVVFSFFFLKEKLGLRSFIGLVLIVAGTLVLLI